MSSLTTAADRFRAARAQQYQQALDRELEAGT